MSRRKTLSLLAGIAAAATALASVVRAEQRIALIVGNSAYSRYAALPNAKSDARSMAETLRTLGFKVIEVEDGSRKAMKSALDDFTAGLHPGDTALFYYAGHGVQGQAARADDGVDNYFVPIDAQLASADRVPLETVSLTEVLTGMEQAQAGARIVILDACRENPFAQDWNKGQRGLRRIGGLATPTSPATKGVYIAFATAPGSFADDNVAGSNGLFTGEILKAIATPGQTVSKTFNLVTLSVDRLSDGKQTPWSTSSGAAAELVLVPGAAPQHPTNDELSVLREGSQCATQVCFDSHLKLLSDPELKGLLQAKAKVWAASQAGSAGSAAASAAPAGLKPSPGPPEGLLPAAVAFIRNNQDTADGRLRIAHAYAAGAESLPANAGEAFRWTESAASGDDPTPVYELAMLHRDGVGTPKNRAEALKRLVQAAEAGSVNAMYEASRLYAKDAPGMPHDYAAMIKWQRAAVDKGDARAMYNLAASYINGQGVTADGKEGLRLLRAAADKGNVDALYGVGTCYNNGEACGIETDKIRAITYFGQAADKGSALGALAIGTCYARGNCGLAVDQAQAFKYYKAAADLGNVQALTFLGAHYDQGLAPVSADPVQAIAYFRKAADLGEPLAMNFIGIHYDFGTGVPQDRAAARFWYQQAADLGDETGKKAVAAMDDLDAKAKRPLTPEEAAKLKACAAEVANHKDDAAAFFKACMAAPAKS